MRAVERALARLPGPVSRRRNVTNAGARQPAARVLCPGALLVGAVALGSHCAITWKWRPPLRDGRWPARCAHKCLRASELFAARSAIRISELACVCARARLCVLRFRANFACAFAAGRIASERMRKERNHCALFLFCRRLLPESDGERTREQTIEPANERTSARARNSGSEGETAVHKSVWSSRPTTTKINYSHRFKLTANQYHVHM